MKDVAAGERRDLAEQGQIWRPRQVFGWVGDGQGGVDLVVRRGLLVDGEVVDAQTTVRQRRLVLARPHLLEGEGPAGAGRRGGRNPPPRPGARGAPALSLGRLRAPPRGA